MNNTQNHTTILYVELGKKTISKEESELRAKITRRILPDNDQIMAYPYPREYHVDRFINLQVFNSVVNGKMVTSYSIAFVHRCLLWQHTRVYDLTADEFSEILINLQNKYGVTDRHYISDDNETINFSSGFAQTSQIALYWYPEKFSLGNWS